MQTSTITLTTPDGPMDAYEAVPDGTPRGAIVVVQEAFGVNDHMQDVTRRAAEAGYRAVSPELFHRIERGHIVAYDDMNGAVSAISGITNQNVLDDVDAVFAHLRSEGFDDTSIGLVGFCMGGRVAFLEATNRAFGASVCFYGGMIVTQFLPQVPPIVDMGPNLQTPFLGIFGEADVGIPMADVEAIRDSLPATPPNEVVTYPDADHGFHCDDRPGVFHKEAAAQGWARALDWFGTYLKA